ncbi:MAG: CBS domain-containing protein [Gemmatimonadaceae bacterium]|nr:CBS domain-containing protein [Chitinophagaceae bacterium]
MRNVKDIIESKPEVQNIIAPSELVINALTEMFKVNLSYLVVKEEEEYKGIFCERDYSRNVILKGRTSDKTKVDEVMTTDLPVVKLSDSVEHCMNLINSQKSRYLVALNGDSSFAGIITIHDLLRQVIASKEDVFDDKLTQKLIDHDESGRIY